MYAVLQVPEFALQAALRTCPEGGSLSAAQPVALLQAGARRGVGVTALNRAARTAGVALGQTAPQALARCAALRLFAAQPAAESDAQAALLAVAFSLAPSVEETAAGLVTADVRALPAERRAPALRQARGRLAQLGLEATAALAATPLLACYAAQHTADVAVVAEGADFLRELPLAVADPTPDQAAVLAGWGVRTLGALTALPKARIAERLGGEGVRLWERAAGADCRPLRTALPPRAFRAHHEGEEAMEKLDTLLFVLRRLLDRLMLELGNALLAAGAVRLDLTTEDGAVHARTLRLPEPTTAPDLVFRALHTYLETMRTNAAIHSVTVQIEPVRPLIRQQGIFDSSLRDVHGFTETLARAMAVVGSERVGTPVAVDTHADDAVRLEAPAVALPEPQPTAAVPWHGLALRRWRPPGAATVELTEEEPTFVWTERVRGAVEARRGPWVGAGGWWEAGRHWTRQEWDVELAGGGLYRLVRTSTGWFVDGEYD